MIGVEWYTGGMAATNGYLLENEAGKKILIDAPEGVADWLSSRGDRVEALLLTHQHFDHVLGASEVVAEFKCPVYGFAPPSADLTLEELLPFAGITQSIPAYPVDEVLEGQAQLELSALGWSWDLLHVPGHSPDSICFYAKGEGLLFAGDTLFRRGIGRFDFPHSDGELLLKGIHEKLLSLPDETKVYPGHMDPTTIGEERLENPYLQD